MTDQPVQPEAPTTEAGRRLLDQWNPGHVNPRLVQTVLAIEAEAYRQGWDANTATSFGNRAASQERPQPIHFKHDDWWCECGSRVEDCDYLQENLRAQERPQVITGYVNPDGSGEGNWDE
jgi:hypothetical protein